MPFDLQAHRGGAGLWPENTLEAFGRALALGVSTLELDVHLTAEDDVVVHHDPALADARVIRRLTRDDLPPTMPLLRQVAALLRERGADEVGVNLEIKYDALAAAELTSRTAFVEVVLEALRVDGLVDRTSIQCFDWGVLRRVGRAEPALRRNLLVSPRYLAPDGDLPSRWFDGTDVSRDWVQAAGDHGFDAISPVHGSPFASGVGDAAYVPFTTAEVVAQAHDPGWACCRTPFDDAPTMRHNLVDRGRRTHESGPTSCAGCWQTSASNSRNPIPERNQDIPDATWPPVRFTRPMHLHLAGKLTGRVTKWIVLVLWLVVLGVSLMFASKLTGVQNNEASSWLPESAESTRALEALAPFQDQNDIPTVVVYERDGGLTESDMAAIEQQAQEFAGLEGVPDQLASGMPSVQSPAVAAQLAKATGQPATGVSSDGEVAQTVVTLNLGDDGWNAMPDVADEMRDIAQIDGVDVHLAGPGGQAADAAEAFAGIDGTLLGATLLVVVVILLFTYRSPVLWIVPIFTAVTSLFTTEAVIYWLAKDHGLVVNGQSQGILTVLVIGAGTDYALLLIARYREELRRHEDRHEAMAFALHRAAPAILASAATVAVGMLCLTFADMSSTAGLGPVNAIGVVITFLAMVTLLPALLVIFGRWVFWPRRPAYGSDEPTAHGLWARVGRAIAHRPRGVGGHHRAAGAGLPLGMVQLDATGLASDKQYTKEYDSVVGQQVLEDHGMVDTSNPVMVATDPEHVETVAEVLGDTEGVGDVNTSIPAKDGVALVTAALSTDAMDQASLDTVQSIRDQLDRHRRGRCAGRRVVGDDPRHRARLRPRQPGGDPAGPAGGAVHPDRPAASARRTDPADPHRRPVVRRRTRPVGPALPVRLRLRHRRSVAAALRVRLPRGAGHRLQHLPDDACARGDPPARHAPGLADRPERHRRRDHLGRARARRDVRGAEHDADGRLRAGRRRRGAGRAARHDDRAVRPGDRAQPRPRRQDLATVAAGRGGPAADGDRRRPAARTPVG